MTQQHNKVLEEGLRKHDLVDLVYPTFEVDKFRSKMGEDRDVCVVTFQAKDRYPARDLMEFIEKGFSKSSPVLMLSTSSHLQILHS